MFSKILQLIKQLFVGSFRKDKDRDPPEPHKVSGYYRDHPDPDVDEKIFVSTHTRGGSDD